MKRPLLLTSMILVIGLGVNAQYCPITNAIAYTMDMPGISNVTIANIDRTSMAIECGGANCNSYVNTGDTTTLERGKTYTVSVTHTRDANLFPNVANNIRVWIDWDNNGSFLDLGETVYSTLSAFGTSSGSFTVPLDATIASTGMRVTAKMGADGGHIDPTPCDVPADPIDYHGEVEDYTIHVKDSIVPPVAGIATNVINEGVRVYPNPSSGIIHFQSETNISTIEIMNVLGEKINIIAVNNGKGLVDLSAQPKGIYLYSLTSGEAVIAQGKLLVE